jgi:hypothetical protein
MRSLELTPTGGCATERYRLRWQMEWLLQATLTARRRGVENVESAELDLIAAWGALLFRGRAQIATSGRPVTENS